MFLELPANDLNWVFSFALMVGGGTNVKHGRDLEKQSPREIGLSARRCWKKPSEYTHIGDRVDNHFSIFVRT